MLFYSATSGASKEGGCWNSDCQQADDSRHA